GAYTDTETGLLYLKTRYYNPTLTAFHTLDSADTINRYGYAFADPVNNVDPNGQLSQGVQLGISIALLLAGAASIYFAPPIGTTLTGAALNMAYVSTALNVLGMAADAASIVDEGYSLAKGQHLFGSGVREALQVAGVVFGIAGAATSVKARMMANVAEMDSLVKDRDIARAVAKSHGREADSLRVNMNKMKDELTDLKTGLDSKQRELNDVENRLKNLGGRLRETNTENASLKGEYDLLLRDKQRIENELRTGFIDPLNGLADRIQQARHEIFTFIEARREQLGIVYKNATTGAERTVATREMQKATTDFSPHMQKLDDLYALQQQLMNLQPAPQLP
ncbi:RHS repeat-associated core domain-containing protein, partial [Streptomyces sp. NPDC008343]|uniref:RHS repeat-associated core domain-containing protein n=1 Tax=Streptomyces sp. NPDC008343 TaxID=3364828 RepID=UPI0036F011A1